jgi:hypothetical protein
MSKTFIFGISCLPRYDTAFLFLLEEAGDQIDLAE